MQFGDTILIDEMFIPTCPALTAGTQSQLETSMRPCSCGSVPNTYHSACLLLPFNCEAATHRATLGGAPNRAAANGLGDEDNFTHTHNKCLIELESQADNFHQ